MPKYLAAFLATALAFCALDAAWLGFIAVDFYQSELGPLLLEQPNLTAAALFYLLFIGGIQIFAVHPAHGNPGAATGRGALFGFFTYMTYDLTNLATLRQWSELVVIVDIVWGTVLTALAAAAGCLAAKWCPSTGTADSQSR
jgi:uncharacterized membrane protein